VHYVSNVKAEYPIFVLVTLYSQLVPLSYLKPLFLCQSSHLTKRVEGDMHTSFKSIISSLEKFISLLGVHVANLFEIVLNFD
jgi:hypothetical protein